MRRWTAGQGVWLRAVGAACCTLAPSLHAQAVASCPPVQRVLDVGFVGSQIEPKELATVLDTHRGSLWARFVRRSKLPCLDAGALPQDALRIAVLHRQRGWYAAAVSSELTEGARGVRVRFVVRAGVRARIDSIAVRGLPAESDAAPLIALRGAPLDRTTVQAVADRVVGRLHESGYVRGRQVQTDVQIDSSTSLASVAFVFDAGVPLRVGTVEVAIEGVGGRAPRTSEALVRRLARLPAGAPYRASDVLAAQQRLYQTDAFRVVLLDTVTAGAPRTDSVMNVRIRVAEARLRSARAGAGWGTLECGRVQGRITDRGFLGVGRRVELVARASRIGIGRPLDQWPGLCPQFLREDPYSQELNYYLGVSLTNTRLFGLPVAPTINVFSERRGEYNAFLRETDLGANIELLKALGQRTAMTVGAELSTGRTVTDAVLACVRFALCQPLDFALARQGNTTRAIDAAWWHDRVGSERDPRYGGRLRADARLGDVTFQRDRSFGRTAGRYGFFRPTLEASGFTRLALGTLAARVQWSQVVVPRAPELGGEALLPPQERLYSGGQSSVRGYQQNQLGPVVYRVDRTQVDSIPFEGSYQLVARDGAIARTPAPEGGTGSLVANVEFRRRFAWPTTSVQWVAFLDAGAVWSRGVVPFAWNGVRTTPGLGVRVDTPLGPFRIDVGYNPRRVDAGRAFLFERIAVEPGSEPVPRVICVSPGQVVPFDDQVAVGGFGCPRTFVPGRGSSLLSRLVFHFSLGQAF